VGGLWQGEVLSPLRITRVSLSVRHLYDVYLIKLYYLVYSNRLFVAICDGVATLVGRGTAPALSVFLGGNSLMKES